MPWRFILTVCCLGLAVVLFRDDSAARDSAANKSNLDLPYNAAGEGDEEELAPALISFYGGTYEANAVVYCLDYSKSMRNGHRELQTREIFKSITELTSDTKFGIVFYGGGVELFRQQLVDATQSNKSAALNMVTATPLSLGTCMGPAVKRARRLAQGTSRAVVILAGDGKPTTCPHTKGADKDQIRRQIINDSRANAEVTTIVHTIYVGNPNQRVELDFMRRLSVINGGTFRVVATD